MSQASGSRSSCSFHNTQVSLHNMQVSFHNTQVSFYNTQVSLHNTQVSFHNKQVSFHNTQGSFSWYAELFFTMDIVNRQIYIYIVSHKQVALVRLVLFVCMEVMNFASNQLYTWSASRTVTNYIRLVLLVYYVSRELSEFPSISTRYIFWVSQTGGSRGSAHIVNIYNKRNNIHDIYRTHCL